MQCVMGEEPPGRSGTGLSSGHLPGRAAHIDVDDVRAGSFRDARSLRHPMRLASHQLDDVQGEALPRRPQTRIGTPLCQVLACHHFRDDEPGAEARDQPPERLIGHPRHGSQENRIRQHHIADRNRVTSRK